MAAKKEKHPNSTLSDVGSAVVTPLTTDLVQRYGHGEYGVPTEQQITNHLIRRMAHDIGHKRQTMTAARAFKDHQLRSMVTGLTQMVIARRHPSERL